MKKLLAIVLILLHTNAYASANNSDDEKTMTVYVQYYTAIVSSVLCNQANFANKDEEKKFKDNFNFVKANIAAMIKRRKPSMTIEEIEDYFNSMENRIQSDISSFYEKDGCSNEVIKDALVWNENFKKMESAPKLIHQ